VRLAPQSNKSQVTTRTHIHTQLRSHPPGRGRWHAPSSHHLRALLSVCARCSFGGLGCCSCRVLLSVCGRCSFGGLGCCSCRVRVCVGVGGVVLCRCVCVCDLLIFLHTAITKEPSGPFVVSHKLESTPEERVSLRPLLCYTERWT